MITGSWRFEECKSRKDAGFVVCETRNDRQQVWKTMKERKDEFYRVGEWLDWEDRRARFKLLEWASKKEEEAEQEGLAIKVLIENKRIGWKGKWYVWNKEKEEVEQEIKEVGSNTGEVCNE